MDDSDPNNWEYDMVSFIVTGEKTTGTQAIADIDGDGYTEIISAGYSVGKVYVHTFAP